MRTPTKALARLCSVGALVVTAACSTPPPDEADAGSGDAGSIDQNPPEGDAALQAWLADELYLDWTCQPSVGPGADSSIHGRRRICHNDVLAAALDGEPLPVGSAVVKELYNDNDERQGTAVLKKVAEGSTGASWYWYERIGVVVTADGKDAAACTVCHAFAEDEGGREMIYVDVE